MTCRIGVDVAVEVPGPQCHDLAAENPDKLQELQALWFSEAARYNGLPLADFNILETLGRSRPYLVGERSSYIYYPDCADVGIGAAAEIISGAEPLYSPPPPGGGRGRHVGGADAFNLAAPASAGATN